MISRKKLADEEISSRLGQIPGWSYSDGRIRREFKIGGFSKGVELINRIAPLADELNHHPDVFLTYPKVTIEIYTHDVGGITEFDFELAKRISTLTG